MEPFFSAVLYLKRHLRFGQKRFILGFASLFQGPMFLEIWVRCFEPPEIKKINAVWCSVLWALHELRQEMLLYYLVYIWSLHLVLLKQTLKQVCNLIGVHTTNEITVIGWSDDHLLFLKVNFLCCDCLMKSRNWIILKRESSESHIVECHTKGPDICAVIVGTLSDELRRHRKGGPNLLASAYLQNLPKF